MIARSSRALPSTASSASRLCGGNRSGCSSKRSRSIPTERLLVVHDGKSADADVLEVDVARPAEHRAAGASPPWDQVAGVRVSAADEDRVDRVVDRKHALT